MFYAILEGMRMFSRNMHVKMHGFNKYPGSNDERICRKIIDGCYDRKSKYFRASNGNYKVFYSRDFGWCIKSLLNLGYRKEVNDTLKYALDRYARHGMITVAINGNGKAFNFPSIYSPDSTAYMFRSLRIAKAKRLVLQYKKFLNGQTRLFEKEVIDEKGLLKRKHFSGMRDHIKEYYLCYDMIMACTLCDEIDRINSMIGTEVLENPLKKYDLKGKLLKYYWNGKYFDDGLNDRYCSGHANTYPYFLELVSDRQKIKSSIKAVQKNHLDAPIPLKYGYSANTRFIWQSVFVKDWEKDTVWVMLGMAYIDTVSKVNKALARKYLDKYRQLIIKNKCFIEIYSDKKGTVEPYRSFFFASDDSMLWASMYLNLKQKLKK